jgi:hypothetical protein
MSQAVATDLRTLAVIVTRQAVRARKTRMAQLVPAWTRGGARLSVQGRF